MKGGAVVSIRLSPADVMSIIDTMHETKAFYPGMSLSGAVSLGLSIALEELRKQGKLPRRDGFEYSEMIAPFEINKKNSKHKRAFSDRMYANAVAGQHASLSGDNIPAIPEDLSQLSDEEIIQRQMEELDRAGL